MLLDPGTINATNSLLGVLLAGLMTAFWVRNGRKATAFYWMSAAWLLAMASVLFTARIWLPFAPCTMLATISVTLGMLFLLIGIELFLGFVPSWKTGSAIALCHATGLGCILAMDATSEVRMLLNSLFWAGFSSATLICYRKADTKNWRELYPFPVLVLSSHAAFHGLRVLIVLLHQAGIPMLDPKLLASLSFAESSAFSVTLFMSLLLSDLRLRNRLLRSALDEVQVLSGLLPICSGCKKIRDDAGYWTKLETYISQHSGAQFSHGLCPDCAMTLYPDVFAGKYAEHARRICAKHGTQPTVKVATKK